MGKAVPANLQWIVSAGRGFDEPGCDQLGIARWATDGHETPKRHARLGDQHFLACSHLVESWSGSTAKFGQRNLHSQIIVRMHRGVRRCIREHLRLTPSVVKVGDEAGGWGRYDSGMENDTVVVEADIADEALVEDELLVEEISIDGMCGVY